MIKKFKFSHCSSVFLMAICVFLLPAFCSPLTAATFHAILVADIADETVGHAIQLDLDNLKMETQRIAKHTGLNLKETVFHGHQPEQLMSHLQKLKVKPDDLIMFFYSGHGYHSDAEGHTPWPNLNFHYNQGMALKDVIEVCQQKKARLTLIFSNCCNALIPHWAAPKLIKPKAKLSALAVKNYQKLFLNAKGMVVMTSSERGEFSWSNQQGGLFTNAWLEALKKMSKTPTSDVSWQAFLVETNSNVLKKGAEADLEQHPFFLNSIIH